MDDDEAAFFAVRRPTTTSGTHGSDLKRKRDDDGWSDSEEDGDDESDRSPSHRNRDERPGVGDSPSVMDTSGKRHRATGRDRSDAINLDDSDSDVDGDSRTATNRKSRRGRSDRKEADRAAASDRSLSLTPPPVLKRRPSPQKRKTRETGVQAVADWVDVSAIEAIEAIDATLDPATSSQRTDSFVAPTEDAIDQTPPLPVVPDPRDECKIECRVTGVLFDADASSMPMPDKFVRSRQVKIKLGQKLTVVRDFVCSDCGIDPSEHDAYVMVYKNVRTFNHTTARQLGIGPGDKPDFELVLKRSVDQLGKPKPQDESASDDPSVGRQEDRSNEVEGQTEKVAPIKLILRTEDGDSLTCRISVHVHVSKLINAAKSKFQAENVTLLFEGEKLDPDAKIEDCDVEDGDCIDTRLG